MVDEREPVALRRVHHVALIVSDYERSKDFYTRILGYRVVRETFRRERESYKLDLTLDGTDALELFSFPSPPARVSNPEATGLRPLAFAVTDVATAVERLQEFGVSVEPVRVDPTTGRRYTFFADPDGLPLEVYEDD